MSQQQPQQSPPELMPKVDLEKDRQFLSQAQLNYMRVIQAQNQERVNRLKRIKRTNLVTGSLLGFGVVSIFCYSIWSVGSEKIFEDFNLPPGKEL